MKKILLLAVVALGCGAMPVPAFASPWNRNCGSHMDGFVLGMNPPYAYVVSGPWHIKISPGEAATLAARFPPGEFGARVTTQEVPCIVAQAIAYSAGSSWLHWRHGHGSSKVKALTSGGRTRIGTFHCTSVALSGKSVARVTCRYCRNVIVGGFTISRNPYSASDNRTWARS